MREFKKGDAIYTATFQTATGYYWFEHDGHFDQEADEIPEDGVYGPFGDMDEVLEHQRVTLLGPQCEVRDMEATIRYVEEGAEPVVYLDYGGRPIAKRHPRASWISLEPGWIVTGAEPGSYDTISVEYDPDQTTPH
jgi:hypothetical protein